MFITLLACTYVYMLYNISTAVINSTPEEFANIIFLAYALTRLIIPIARLMLAGILLTNITYITSKMLLNTYKAMWLLPLALIHITSDITIFDTIVVSNFNTVSIYLLIIVFHILVFNVTINAVHAYTLKLLNALVAINYYILKQR